MATVTANGKASLSAAFTPASGFYNSKSSPSRSIENKFTNGNSGDQVNLVGGQTFTFTASNAQDINFQSSLIDPQGTAVNFARVREVLFKVTVVNASATLTIDAHDTNGATAIIATNGNLVLRGSTNTNPSGLMLFAPDATGYAITNSTKVLTMTPSAHAMTVEVIAVGSLT